MDNGNFASDATTTVSLGPCRCPGTPHDEDSAEVLEELPWHLLAEVGTLNGISAYRRLVLGALVGWNLVDGDGQPVEITPALVDRLRPARLEPIAAAIQVVFDRANAPLPNASGAPSRPSRPASASPNPTIRPRAKRGK